MKKRTFVVTGCSSESSLGYKICEQLKILCDDASIIACAHPRCDMDFHSGRPFDYLVKFDLTNDWEIIDVINSSPIFYTHSEIFCLINCAGINGNFWFEDCAVSDWDRIMNVNVRAPFLMAQLLLSKISRANGTILNIVSNAARVPMRCSTAYNASKSAALMMTMQLARELTRKFNITVFSVSPNKLSGTEMTKYVDKNIPNLRGWSDEQALKYQLDALTTGKETDPNTLAEFIAFLLSKKERHFYLSGCDLHYGN
jgi:NAD(P)-dependent dehydrogenase (short-subunit alcohol dehydrogenase family)